jgi:4-hydroxy-tetrahydrodipicolinate reductase
MGQVVAAIIKEDAQTEVVAGVDVTGQQDHPFPVFPSIRECNIEADVVIDFASVDAMDGLLQVCAERKLPAVICTTGLSSVQTEQVQETAKQVAILRSANMSLGINLLLKLLKQAAGVLADAGFDMEIVEKHHNQKKDAPSGTALALADALKEGAGGTYEYVYDRSKDLEKRKKEEIGISAVRGGTIVGDHEVIFAGRDEVLTFQHTAYSRSIFGKGAVSAAKFLAGKPAGLYTMSDVIEAVLEQ